MIAILISMALMGQVEELPPSTPAKTYVFGYMSYRSYPANVVKQVMADRAKFYKAVASGEVKVEETYLSEVRGLVRRDLQETEKIIKEPSTPRNMKSLAKVHFRITCDAMSALEKQKPGG